MQSRVGEGVYLVKKPTESDGLSLIPQIQCWKERTDAPKFPSDPHLCTVSACAHTCAPHICTINKIFLKRN